MTKQNFFGQKSPPEAGPPLAENIKSGLPWVALIIVICGALIVLGLILLATSVFDDQVNLRTENQNQNQNSNEQILLPIKNSAQVKPQPINLNFSLTNEVLETNEQATYIFDQTYSNREYGFSVAFPQEYIHQESKPEGALFAVSFLGLAEDLPVITIYNDRTLALEIENALMQSIGLAIEIEKKSYSHLAATLITTGSPDSSSTSTKRVVWEKDGYLFELSGVKSDDFLTKMLNSLLFL